MNIKLLVTVGWSYFSQDRKQAASKAFDVLVVLGGKEINFSKSLMRYKTPLYVAHQFV